jgi:hypothetical protein
VTPARRLAIVAWALCTAGAAPACELILAEHRSGHELLRVPMPGGVPEAEIVFTHSVLGTPVADRYAWRLDGGAWRAHLVEERFEGEGYGLAHAAGSGETLVRAGGGWRLVLDRVVDPLVVLPLPAQQMRLLLGDGTTVLLGMLSQRSIGLRVDGCPAR